MLGAKNRFKQHLLLNKRERFENGQYRPRCMGYSPCKMLSLGQRLKMPKSAKSDCLTSLKVLCPKNRSKKHLLLEKRERFENGQNRPRCMGYRPCKMLSLGQKLKMPKRYEKRFYEHIEVVVCKKPLQKTPNIRKMTAV